MAARLCPAAVLSGYGTRCRLSLAKALVAGLSLAPVFASHVRAQEALPDVPNSLKTLHGKLNANALVFSGPGTNYYPTLKLPANTEVVVVGKAKEWLKIVPPEGSFSYVSRAFVNAQGDGKRGKVNNQLVVKAGSSLQPAKWAVQTKLEANDTVQILGEEDEYYKIKPPEGTYAYINEASVTPISPAGKIVDPPLPPELVTLPPKTTAPLPPGVAGGSTSDGIKITQTPTMPAPTTRQAVAGGSAVPSTQPVSAALLTDLQNLETEFTDISKQPLTEQPVAELLAKYQTLAAAPGLPDMAKRIADVRVSTLTVRSEAKDQFVEVQKKQQEMQERSKVQTAEREEIQQRIKEMDIQVYAAIGTLRTSSLQISRTPLYRLTDPQSGRTVVYVWGTDPKVAELVGQFVGVKGPMQTDARLNLKVVTPSATDVVDVSKVNTSVAAEIVPPSLLPKPAPTASTAGQ